MSSLTIHKFGGSSLPDSRCAAATERIRALPVGSVVVASACAGVTDRLVALCDAKERPSSPAALLEATGMEPTDGFGPETESVAELLETALRALARPEIEDRDPIHAVGEKLATVALAAALRTRGLAAEALFADAFLPTDDRPGRATPLWDQLGEALPAAILPLLARRVVPIVTGFIGHDATGRTRTLGRGGSDVTAAALAVGLGAAEVTLWTDVSGIHSADPKRVPEAHLLPHLHFEEARALARCGGHVLHPGTIPPLALRGIPLRVRGTFSPDAECTRIDEEGESPIGRVRALAVELSGPHPRVHLIGREIERAGPIRQRLEALAHGAPELFHSAAGLVTGEGSLGVRVLGDHLDEAARRLHREFSLDRVVSS